MDRKKHEGPLGFELPPIPDDVSTPVFHHGKKPSPWERIKQWVSDHKKTSIAILIVFILLLGGGAFALYAALQPKGQAKINLPVFTKPEPKPVDKPKFYSPLTGREVANEGETKRSVTGIMLENSEWARPQSGLNAAGVVFEAIAEGGITRFAALYQDTKPELIGPVRSIRPYYVDWMAAFDPTIVHIGGSANALKEVRGGGYKDADQFFNPGYFWIL